MKTISYDPNNYEVTNIIHYNDKMFQIVEFPDGNYGVVYVTLENNTHEVILVSTGNNSSVIDFLEFASDEFLKDIYTDIDEVELQVHLSDKQSEIFRQVVSKVRADDLIERLLIANEIQGLEDEDDKFILFASISVIAMIVIIIAIIICLILTALGAI